MGMTWYAVGTLATAQRHDSTPHTLTQLPGVAVAPHLVVLTHDHSTGRVMVFNPNTTAAELSVELRYGLVASDPAGNTVVRFHHDASASRSTSPENPMNRANDTPANTRGTSVAHASAAQPSDTQVDLPTTRDVDTTESTHAAPWLSAYPHTFILNPGASQIIHVSAKPPAGTPPGEYWSRLVIHTRPLTTPSQPQTDTEQAVHVGLALEMSTVIPVFYRTGPVTTGIAIDALSTTRTNDSLTIHPLLRRTGNGAYIGVAQLTLTDTNGIPITNTLKRLAVYTTLSPRWTLTIPPTAPPGPYRLTLLLTTNRPDAPKGTILRAKPVGQTLDHITW